MQVIIYYNLIIFNSFMSNPFLKASNLPISKNQNPQNVTCNNLSSLFSPNTQSLYKPNVITSAPKKSNQVLSNTNLFVQKNNQKVNYASVFNKTQNNNNLINFDNTKNVITEIKPVTISNSTNMNPFNVNSIKKEEQKICSSLLQQKRIMQQKRVSTQSKNVCSNSNYFSVPKSSSQQTIFKINKNQQQKSNMKKPQNLGNNNVNSQQQKIVKSTTITTTKELIHHHHKKQQQKYEQIQIQETDNKNIVLQQSNQQNAITQRKKKRKQKKINNQKLIIDIKQHYKSANPSQKIHLLNYLKEANQKVYAVNQKYKEAIGVLKQQRSAKITGFIQKREKKFVLQEYHTTYNKFLETSNQQNNLSSRQIMKSIYLPANDSIPKNYQELKQLEAKLKNLRNDELQLIDKINDKKISIQRLYDGLGSKNFNSEPQIPLRFQQSLQKLNKQIQKEKEIYKYVKQNNLKNYQKNNYNSNIIVQGLEGNSMIRAENSVMRKNLEDGSSYERKKIRRIIFVMALIIISLLIIFIFVSI